MLMLALPTIGLLALRCVDALAPLFILLFNFFDLAAHHRHPHLSTCSSACVSRCAKLTHGPKALQAWAALRQLWGSGQLPHPAGHS